MKHLIKISSIISIVFFVLLLSCSKKELINTKVEINNREFNFGNILNTDTVHTSFRIKNLSKTPLKIFEVGSSCGCTAISYSKELIRQNEFALIEIEFIPKKNEFGKIAKSIVVKCNIDSTFINFQIKGIVQK